MDALCQDLKFALRTLRRTPAFIATAVLTLALGIGASPVVYSVAPSRSSTSTARSWSSGCIPDR
jgi:hypothetical protein